MLEYRISDYDKITLYIHLCNNLLNNLLCRRVTWYSGGAIAQAVSRRLPTAATRVQTRVWSCGIL
jgi:hypothetical protein